LGSATAEIGYALGKTWWGQGYASEAIQALIDYAFVVLGLRRLTAHVDTRNQASHQLLLKLGFTHEGILREDSVMKGELTSGNIYGLLRREWEK
jgi:ribosomal-protein-alanine N-acetyltransferase